MRYRVGTYASFYESMLARLTNLPIDVPSPYGDGSARYYPLKALTTRAPDDPSIALLDAFAIVADVLTFYQERIANEGYLPTADRAPFDRGAGQADRLSPAARRRRERLPRLHGRRGLQGRPSRRHARAEHSRRGRAAAILRNLRRPRCPRRMERAASHG